MKPALILITAVTLTLSSTAFSQSQSVTGSDNPNANLPRSRNTLNNSAIQSEQQSSQHNANASSDSNKPSREDKEFVRDSGSGNKMEIEVGQYIAEHTQNPQVKQYAQTLVQDHQQSQEQLKQAASQAGVSFSDQLTPEHKAMLKELKQKSGDDLNRDFVFSAIADHHKDILEFTYASQHLQNQQLKQYAQQTIPTLQKHLQLANTLSQSITGVQDNSTASAR
ncbi:MAG: DUF4142 domain-containing protein [Phycisphaerae bacterium]